MTLSFSPRELRRSRKRQIGPESVWNDIAAEVRTTAFTVVHEPRGYGALPLCLVRAGRVVIVLPAGLLLAVEVRPGPVDPQPA